MFYLIFCSKSKIPKSTPTLMSASLPTRSYLRTAIPDLDTELLHKLGLPSKCLIEFVGASGTGKTQLVLSLLLSAQLPKSLGGLADSVGDEKTVECIYICTDGPAPISRLYELAEHFHCRYPGMKSNVEDWLSGVWMQCIYDLEVLEHVIQFQVPEWMRRRNGRVRLIIVDSIASNFRYGRGDEDGESGLLVMMHGSGGDSIGRSVSLARIVSVLKRVADEYDSVVICTNQVTTRPTTTSTSTTSTSTTSTSTSNNGAGKDASMDVPALGVSWANWVNMRVWFEKSERGKKREICIQWAPHIRSGMKIPFYITDIGLASISTHVDSI